MCEKYGCIFSRPNISEIFVSRADGEVEAVSVHPFLACILAVQIVKDTNIVPECMDQGLTEETCKLAIRAAFCRPVSVGEFVALHASETTGKASGEDLML